MKLVKRGAVALVASLVSVMSFADVLGGSVAATYWYPSMSGDISSGGDNIQVDDDLGFDDEGAFIISGVLEHPVPFLPNVRLQYYSIDDEETGSLDNVSYKGINFDGEVHTDIDLSHIDVTLYYEILDNWVNLDVGLTAKVFDGELTLTNEDGESSKSNINHVLPMLYGSAVFEFPITNLSAGVEGSVLTFDGDTAYDVVAKVRYTYLFMGVEAGYRALGVDVDDISGIDVDTRLDGPFISAMAVF